MLLGAAQRDHQLRVENGKKNAAQHHRHESRDDFRFERTQRLRLCPHFRQLCHSRPLSKKSRTKEPLLLFILLIFTMSTGLPVYKEAFMKIPAARGRDPFAR